MHAKPRSPQPEVLLAWQFVAHSSDKADPCPTVKAVSNHRFALITSLLSGARTSSPTPRCKEMTGLPYHGSLCLCIEHGMTSTSD